MRFVKKTKYPDGVYQEAVIRYEFPMESAEEMVAALVNFSLPNCRVFGGKDSQCKITVERKVFRFLEHSYDNTVVFYVPIDEKEIPIIVSRDEKADSIIEALYKNAEEKFKNDWWEYTSLTQLFSSETLKKDE